MYVRIQHRTFKRICNQKKLYDTVDLKMYKLDPDKDDPSGVAARQLLVGLIPLDHRHLLQHNIVSFYNLFIHLSI